jgi:hypothetical protein
MNTSHIGLEPEASIELNYLFKDPDSKHINIFRYCELGLPHMNLGRQNSAYNRALKRWYHPG